MSHRILNVCGEEIGVPKWVISRLDRMKFLFWNRERKMHQLRASVLDWMEFLEQPHFNPRRRVRALDPAQHSGRAPDSGFTSERVKIVGRDGRGQTRGDAACSCRRCRIKEEPLIA